MADDKKVVSKPSGWNLDTVEIIYILIIISALFGTIVPAIINYVNSGRITFFGYNLGGIIAFFSDNAWLLKILGFFLAFVFAVFTFVFTKKGDAIWREIRKSIYPQDMENISLANVVENDPIKDKWKKIVEYSESNTEANWRLAIIEADIILAELLEKLQLPGDTMGDKLKAVEPSDFLTLDQAWEAHKARNMIAHEGSNFLLNQRETRRIISLYEAVFKEFHMI